MLATRINYLLICMLIDVKMAIKWFCENHKCNFYSVNYKKNMVVSDLCSGCFEIKISISIRCVYSCWGRKS